MNQKKRQRDIPANDENEEKKKIQCTSSIVTTTHTHFEDLSNELLYELFEYLDGYHIYESFFNLNTRFQNLITDSTIPINVNILSLSKTTFLNYYTNLIQSNKHRIKSLYLLDPFTIEYFSSSTENISKCCQLQSIILGKIESSCFKYFLSNLISLPNLSSLSIHVNKDLNAFDIYNAMFQLSVLKYCKITFEEPFQLYWPYFSSKPDELGLLPICTNPISPIEHLVIDGNCTKTDMITILSYVPQLRYLSTNYLSGFDRQKSDKLPIILLNNLTHLSLRQVNRLTFNEFEQFIKKISNHLQVLHISTEDDQDYLDADRWEQLILSDMPYLNIFNFDFTHGILYDGKDEKIYQPLLEKFTSPFWFERQWFFEHDPLSTKRRCGSFYSIQPYRKKYFTLNQNSNKATSHVDKVLSSIENIIINDIQSVTKYSNYFPNATELTIFNNHPVHFNWHINNKFQRMIPLIKITKLTMNNIRWELRILINILKFAVNVHTLTWTSIDECPQDVLSIQKSETFRLVSNQNQIKNIMIKHKYTKKMMEVLIDLCPRVQYISVGYSHRSHEPTFSHLLSEINETTRHLFSICTYGENTHWVKQWQDIIKTREVFNDYSIKIFDGKLYLWWGH